LFFSRFSVTLALPKLLALGKAKEKHVFLLLFSRFSVTLRLQREVTGTRKKKQTSLFCSSLVFP